jgi:hypothetical protein
MGSAIATREKVFRASLEGFGTRHKEPEGIGQPTDHVERETDRERIFDLSAQSAGSEDCSHVIRITTCSRVSLPSMSSVARNGSSMAAVSRSGKKSEMLFPSR